MSVSDWLSLMPFTVSYEAAATWDEYGKVATYAAAVEYRARVTYTHKRVTSRATGQDVVSGIQAWLAGTIPTLNVDDRITLPDGTTPMIAAWDLPTDEVGFHHTKVYFS